MQARILILQVLERLRRALGEGNAHSSDDPESSRPEGPAPKQAPRKHSVLESGTPSRHIEAIAFYLSLLSVLALAAQIIGILTLTVFALLVLACLPATYALFHIPLRGSYGLDARSRWLRFATSLAAASLLMVVSYAVGMSPSQSVGSNEVGSCIYPGSGMPDYRKAFQEAYDRKGGRRQLGCALGDAVKWGDGISQNFQGPDGETVIAAVSQDKAYVLTPEFHKCINSAVSGAQTFPIAGYPFSDPIQIKGGWEILLGAGLSGGPGKNAVFRQDQNEHCYWVKPDFWDSYEAAGGPDGHLGFPTSDAYIWKGQPRQDFERGFLVL